MPFRAGGKIDIKSRGFWFKVVDMLQQNWALIDSDEAGRVTVFFIHHRSGVFDRMTCDISLPKINASERPDSGHVDSTSEPGGEDAFFGAGESNCEVIRSSTFRHDLRLASRVRER